MPKLIKAMESVVIRGDGEVAVRRAVTQYHDLEGRFLAEFDPCRNYAANITQAEASRPEVFDK